MLRHPEVSTSRKLAGEEGFEPSLAEPTKRCSRCGEMKPLDDFYRLSKSSDRRAAWCKTCSNKSRQTRRESHRDEERLVAHDWYLRSKDRVLRYNHDRHQQRKISLVAHYSNNTNRCACCGEPDIRFLTIDHINGNGNQHRKSIGAGSTFYDWLIRAGMPEGYQVLCYNCNIARAWYGICPHQAVVSNSAGGVN
ncbi:hypothetical protein ES706_05245 [subsurface metagenome]